MTKNLAAATAVPSEGQIDWPDLSAYGVHFGLMTMADGLARLVMIDVDQKHDALAKEMGFTASKYGGFHIMMRLNEKGMPDRQMRIRSFKTRFPKGFIAKRSPQSIRDDIEPLIDAQTDEAKARPEPGTQRRSWHPAARATPPSAQQQLDLITPEPAHPTAAQRLDRRVLLGLNALGQEVFDLGSGDREIIDGDMRLSEGASDSKVAAHFLRASSEEDLVIVATGLVRAMETGRAMTADDFARYTDASLGEGAARDAVRVRQMHAALDQAMLQSALQAGEGHASFAKACQLHETRPTYWNPSPRLVAPAPLQIVMRHLGQGLQHKHKAADIVWANASDERLPFAREQRGSDARHHVGTAASLNRIHMDRQNAAALLSADITAAKRSLQNRTSDGTSIFWLPIERTGKLDAASRRFLTDVGRTHVLEAVVDLDPKLLGPGQVQSSRLVVVGQQLADENVDFATPLNTQVLHDYDQLWELAEKLVSGDENALRFGDSSEVNRWQAPYVPASQVSEPETMMPRNLIAPVRRALADLIERHGRTVDTYVAEKLQWTDDELASRLSAEQVDVVALAIDSIDKGSALINADETGIGKGRAAAAIALYGRLIGRKVVYLTGTADLMSDVYRDVAGIGAMAKLGRPFIVNSSVVIHDIDTGEEIARSPSADYAQTCFSCGEFPDDHDLVLATYSQFNRKYSAADARPAVAISRTIRSMINEGMAPFAAICQVSSHLQLPDYRQLGIETAADAAAYERGLAQTSALAGSTRAAEAHRDNAALLELSRDKLIEHLGSLVRADSTKLKHRWLYSGALDGAIVITDESHLAAGETSHTGENIQRLISTASGVAYLSATYSKNVQNFTLYSRLFPPSIRVHTIADTLKRGGEVMQEMLSTMLAEDGKLIRREHDLSSIDVRVLVDSEREARNNELATHFASVLAAVSHLSNEVSDVVLQRNDAYGEEHRKLHMAALAARPGLPGSSIPSMGVAYTNFSSRFYNLTRLFMMALKADFAAERAVATLKRGEKPLITVENTLDSVLKELAEGVAAGEEDLPDASRVQLNTPDDYGLQGSLLGDDGKISGTGPSNLGRRVGFKDIVMAYVDSMFEARLQRRENNRVVSSERISLANPALEAVREEVRKVLQRMPEMPLSPLDHVRDKIKAAGYTVGEITGRQYQLVEDSDGNHAVARYPRRNRLNIRRDFNSGKLDVVILSKQGSLGAGFHASREFKDQRVRVMLELQTPHSITDLKQLRGRHVRKGMVNDPVVESLSSGLPAENRQIAMQNAAFRKLSANTSGSADSASLNERVPDLLNPIGNEVALRWMESNPRVSASIGYKIGEVQEEKLSLDNTRFIDLLTARLVMLDPPTQKRVWSEITAEYHALIEQHELEGSNPLQAAKLDIRASVGSETVLQEATGRASAFDGPVMARELVFSYDLPAVETSTLLQAASEGREKLVQAHGQHFANSVSQQVADAANAALPTLLPRRFKSIEEALASPSKNAVKNAMVRYEWLAHELPLVSPGSVISYRESENAGGVSNGDGSAREEIFVTGWKVPKENLLSLSEFKICGYSVKTRKPIEISMSAWYTREDKTHRYTFNDALPYAEGTAAEAFFQKAGQPLKGTQSRMVLTGNMYRAAEVADSQRTGSSVTYSDASGIWHHGVLLPKGFTPANVKDLPVVVDHESTLVAALASRTAEGTPFNLTDDTRTDVRSRRTYLVAGRLGKLEVFIQNDRKAAWLAGDKGVRECLVGGTFVPGRTTMRGQVRAGLENAFLTEFMRAANAAAAAVVFPGHMRAWHNQYLRDLAPKELNQRNLDAALSDGAFTEIQRLLAAAP